MRLWISYQQEFAVGVSSWSVLRNEQERTYPIVAGGCLQPLY